MTDTLAFPSHGSMGEVAQDGMTLRDYFAAKAMVYVAGTAELDHVGPAELAAACYEHADAMLFARQDFVVRQDIAAVERQIEIANDRGDRMRDALRGLADSLLPTDSQEGPARAALVHALAILADDENIPF